MIWILISTHVRGSAEEEEEEEDGYDDDDGRLISSTRLLKSQLVRSFVLL